MVAAIREVDDCHIVFLGGAQWNSNFSVFGAPFDPNAVYTFHKYWTNVEQAEIQSYCDYRDQYNVPLWMGESGENRDEWIRDFRRLLDKNEIGWCFWPYKKMDSKSCITSFERPPYWDEIQAFVKNRYVELSEIRNVRPPIEHCQTSMAGLLENIRFEKCKLNTGYIEALGLTIEK
jgi:endoglucanase